MFISFNPAIKPLWYHFCFWMQYSHLSHLDAFNAEAQCGCRADGFSPLHVAWFGNCFLLMFLWCWGICLHFNHLLVHVGPQSGLLPGFRQLFFQICPV